MRVELVGPKARRASERNTEREYQTLYLTAQAGRLKVRQKEKCNGDDEYGSSSTVVVVEAKKDTANDLQGFWLGSRMG